MRMFLRAVSLLLLPLAAALADSAGPVPATDRITGVHAITVAFWNVENLFDTEDDPANPGDDPYTPLGWQRWHEERYYAKLVNLGKVIADMDADVIGLCEIENRRVLVDLATTLSNRYDRHLPYVIHREGQDHRGIDVGMLSRFPAAWTNWVYPVVEQRDLLFAGFHVAGAELAVSVNHWKSKLEGESATAGAREDQARALRAEVDHLLARPSVPSIIIAGDFNDNYDGRYLVEVLRAIGDRARVLGQPERNWLYALHSELPPDRAGTIYYAKGKSWNTFDTMCVNRQMLVVEMRDPPVWRVRPGSFEVFRRPYLLNEEGRPLAFRRVTQRDSGRKEFQEGFSDHLPVRVVLELR